MTLKASVTNDLNTINSVNEISYHRIYENEPHREKICLRPNYAHVSNKS